MPQPNGGQSVCNPFALTFVQRRPASSQPPSARPPPSHRATATANGSLAAPINSTRPQPNPSGLTCRLVEVQPDQSDLRDLRDLAPPARIVPTPPRPPRSTSPIKSAPHAFAGFAPAAATLGFADFQLRCNIAPPPSARHPSPLTARPPAFAGE